MRLVSDFNDFYDAAFDGKGPEFRRMTTGGPFKAVQFAILRDAGFSIPPSGRVSEIYGMWWEQEHRWVRRVVAYEDQAAHRGEGKRVLSSRQLQWDGNLGRVAECHRLHGLFCSAFVGTHEFTFPSVSLRVLQIGKHRFWLEYTSFDDWRSNYGDTECSLVGEGEGFPVPTLPFSLYAVDFVLGKEAYAVDLNTAPGIRGSGVEKLLTPREIVAAIEESVDDIPHRVTTPTTTGLHED